MIVTGTRGSHSIQRFRFDADRTLAGTQVRPFEQDRVLHDGRPSAETPLVAKFEPPIIISTNWGNPLVDRKPGERPFREHGIFAVYADSEHGSVVRAVAYLWLEDANVNKIADVTHDALPDFLFKNFGSSPSVEAAIDIMRSWLRLGGGFITGSYEEHRLALWGTGGCGGIPPDSVLQSAFKVLGSKYTVGFLTPAGDYFPHSTQGEAAEIQKYNVKAIAWYDRHGLIDYNVRY